MYHKQALRWCSTNIYKWFTAQTLNKLIAKSETHSTDKQDLRIQQVQDSLGLEDILYTSLVYLPKNQNHSQARISETKKLSQSCDTHLESQYLETGGRRWGLLD